MSEVNNVNKEAIFDSLLQSLDLDKVVTASTQYIRARLREGEAYAQWREQFLKENKTET